MARVDVSATVNTLLTRALSLLHESKSSHFLESKYAIGIAVSIISHPQAPVHRLLKNFLSPRLVLLKFVLSTAAFFFNLLLD